VSCLLPSGDVHSPLEVTPPDSSPVIVPVVNVESLHPTTPPLEEPETLGNFIPLPKNLTLLLTRL
jgi:hypothetical protein